MGVAKNKRLNALWAKLQAEAEAQHKETKEKVRLFGAFEYKAHTWDCKRRVIVKAFSQRPRGQPALPGHQLRARAPGPL